MNEKVKEPTIAELMKRLDAADKRNQELDDAVRALEKNQAHLQGENAALRSRTGQPSVPGGEVDVVFTELAVHTIAGPDGRGQREVVGRPTDKVSLRSDRAEAWMRRGKCVRAGSAEAKAFRSDKRAVAAAIERAEIAEARGKQQEAKRQQKQREQDEAKAAKKAAEKAA